MQLGHTELFEAQRIFGEEREGSEKHRRVGALVEDDPSVLSEDDLVTLESRRVLTRGRGGRAATAR